MPAEARDRFAFDAALMQRFWILENDFLARFDQGNPDLAKRYNRLLLSAVLFGGLLNAAGWRSWLDAVERRLAKVAPGKCLDVSEARSVYIERTEQLWFADPLTQNLLARPVNGGNRFTATVAADDSDYERLISLPKDALIAELQRWVLPAAKVKMTLLWPPLVVEHCAGAVKSKSLKEHSWRRLEQPQPIAFPAEPTQLETIRNERPRREPDTRRRYYLKDKGFSFLCDAILSAIGSSCTAPNPTLDAEREAVKRELEDRLKNHDYYCPSPYPDTESDENNLGWWIHQWLLAFCPKGRLPSGRKPKPKRARTLLDIIITLGLRVDWTDVWKTPLKEITSGSIEKKLLDVVRSKPDSLPMAKGLYAYLGFQEPTGLDALKSARKKTKVKRQILSRPEYEATLNQLLDRDGKCGAHWLAAMLMFRCGLRTREILAMEIDHVIVAGDIVELRVDKTPYVALKTDTSKRTLPLHALLTGEELAALLWLRALRIRRCADNRRHARLLFATVYDPSDYDYLFDPIEAAIRVACGQPAASDQERETPGYIFSRCSVLRHSFVSYAVATMLLPRDDGGFELPAGITPDLVSLARRDRLERALLTEGHLGLSSLEAIRQLTGHANFRRTLGTYTHVLDLVAGAYSWRRSSEPSLPAEVVCALSPKPLKPEAFKRAAHRSGEPEQAALQSAVNALKAGQAAGHVVIARERRPVAQTVPDWMPQGNAFASLLRSKPKRAVPPAKDKIPEWRREDASDWRTLDRIVQMASNGVPTRLIADEVGVRLTVVDRLTRRYHKLLCLRRKTTATRTGKYRHGLLMEDPDSFTGVFDEEHGCWYEPLKPLPSNRRDRIDVMWNRVQARRKDPERLGLLRTWITKHHDGRLVIRRPKRVGGNGTASPALPNGGRTLSSSMTAKQPARTANPGQHQVRPAAERWGPARVLLHLLLLGEAVSPGALPSALVKTPVGTGAADIARKVADDKKQAAKRAKEEAKRQDRAQRSAQRKKEEEARQASKAKWDASRERTEKNMQGNSTYKKVDLSLKKLGKRKRT